MIGRLIDRLIDGGIGSNIVLASGVQALLAQKAGKACTAVWKHLPGKAFTYL